MNLTPEYGMPWTACTWQPRQRTDRPFDDLVDDWYAQDPYSADTAFTPADECDSDLTKGSAR